VVEYSKKKFRDRDFAFSMTTNATLITEEIADFLIKNSFSLMLSIDGPEKIHNMYRIFKNNRGSFNRTMDGLNILNKLYDIQNNEGKFSISMVYSPPYNLKKIEQIYSFFSESQNFKRCLYFNIADPHSGSIPENILTESTNPAEKDIGSQSEEKFIDLYKKGQEIPTLYRNFVGSGLNKIFKRRVTEIPDNNIFLNGCCIPFARKIYVCSNGDIQICERASGAPKAGNINYRLDIEKIKKYFIRIYSDESLKICANCWGNKLCGLCYGHSYESDNFNINKKSVLCKSQKANILNNIILFSVLLRIKPDGLNYLSNYKSR
jgi:uncharacterized protein